MPGFIFILYENILIHISLCNARDTGDEDLILCLGRFPGGEHGNPLQYSCKDNPETEEPGRLQFIGS